MWVLLFDVCLLLLMFCFFLPLDVQEVLSTELCVVLVRLQSIIAYMIHDVYSKSAYQVFFSMYIPVHSTHHKLKKKKMASKHSLRNTRDKRSAYSLSWIH